MVRADRASWNRAEVTVNSNSTNCPPSSAGINVQTTYRFFDPRNSGVNWFGVQRVFDFTATTFAHDFRPYIARLNLGSGYTEVLYPALGGELVAMNASNCPYGCTGPVSAPGAAPLSPAWASAAGWFAVHNPKNGSRPCALNVEVVIMVQHAQRRRGR